MVVIRDVNASSDQNIPANSHGLGRSAVEMQMNNRVIADLDFRTISCFIANRFNSGTLPDRNPFADPNQPRICHQVGRNQARPETECLESPRPSGEMQEHGK